MNYTERMKWCEGMFLAAFAFGLNGGNLPALSAVFVILIFDMVWHSLRAMLQEIRVAVGLTLAESIFLYALNMHSVFLQIFFFLHTVSVLSWRTSSYKEVEPVIYQELFSFGILIVSAFFLPDDILVAANGRPYVIGILTALSLPLLYLLLIKKTGCRGYRVSAYGRRMKKSRGI